MKSYDAAIVGGGIVGVACAASLSSAGLSVLLIEASGIAHGVTAAGMGHIVVMDDSDAQFELTRYSQLLWNELALELPIGAEFENCGTIWIAANEDEMVHVHRKHQYFASRGVISEVLDEKALREVEPNLRYGLTGGLLVSGDSVVYQLVATDFLLKKTRNAGGEVLPYNSAVELSDKGVKLSTGQFIPAGSIVNAAGSAAASLSPSLQIRNRKGHLVITDRSPNFARHQLIELGYLRSAHGDSQDSVAFNVQPRKTGQVLIGSSRQFGTYDPAIDHDILRRMTSRAFEYMPGLRKLSAVRVWTGFRPATPDNLPYIGKFPEHDHVYAAAGHEGLGITTALATGELIADAILLRDSTIPSEPYQPGRSVAEH